MFKPKPPNSEQPDCRGCCVAGGFSKCLCVLLWISASLYDETMFFLLVCNFNKRKPVMSQTPTSSSAGTWAGCALCPAPWLLGYKISAEQVSL